MVMGTEGMIDMGSSTTICGRCRKYIGESERVFDDDPVELCTCIEGLEKSKPPRSDREINEEMYQAQVESRTRPENIFSPTCQAQTATNTDLGAKYDMMTDEIILSDGR